MQPSQHQHTKHKHTTSSHITPADTQPSQHHHTGNTPAMTTRHTSYITAISTINTPAIIQPTITFWSFLKGTGAAHETSYRSWSLGSQFFLHRNSKSALLAITTLPSHLTALERNTYDVQLMTSKR
ncbi:hypothetical protein ACLKA6_001898 [Drosophila palustris]